MGFKDFLLIGLLLIALLVGYDYLTNSDAALTRDIAPGLYATPDAPVLSTIQTPPTPTWTPQPIDFQATTDAYLGSLPTPIPPTAEVIIEVVTERPPFESLPTTGPYTPEQIDVCRATWGLGLEGQLSMFQAQYELCYGALWAEGYFN